MEKPSSEPVFLPLLGIRKKDVVSLVGAGGKTSLMFQLAAEACAAGFKVLVTTTTRILIPEPDLYDKIDLSGRLFIDETVTDPGIYIGGQPDTVSGKMRGVREDLLSYQQRQKTFDLILIEADGAATRPLKGWNSTEPVIPDFTSLTVGVVDIQTIGKRVDETLVHRLEIFTKLFGAEEGDIFSLGHLLRVIIHDEGLFGKAFGREALFLNKVESTEDQNNVLQLRKQIDNLLVVAGSLRRKTCV